MNLSVSGPEDVAIAYSSLPPNLSTRLMTIRPTESGTQTLRLKTNMWRDNYRVQLFSVNEQETTGEIDGAPIEITLFGPHDVRLIQFVASSEDRIGIRAVASDGSMIDLPYREVVNIVTPNNKRLRIGEIHYATGELEYAFDLVESGKYTVEIDPWTEEPITFNIMLHRSTRP
jgi:hypothetical protein